MAPAWKTELEALTSLVVGRRAEVRRYSQMRVAKAWADTIEEAGCGRRVLAKTGTVKVDSQPSVRSDRLSRCHAFNCTTTAQSIGSTSNSKELFSRSNERGRNNEIDQFEQASPWPTIVLMTGLRMQKLELDLDDWLLPIALSHLSISQHEAHEQQ
jgi:hypothetical protein